MDKTYEVYSSNKEPKLERVKLISEIYKVTCDKCHMGYLVRVQPQMHTIEDSSHLLTTTSAQCPFCHRQKVDFVGDTAIVLDENSFMRKAIELDRISSELQSMAESLGYKSTK